MISKIHDLGDEELIRFINISDINETNEKSYN